MSSMANLAVLWQMVYICFDPSIPDTLINCNLNLSSAQNVRAMVTQTRVGSTQILDGRFARTAHTTQQEQTVTNARLGLFEILHC